MCICLQMQMRFHFKLQWGTYLTTSSIIPASETQPVTPHTDTTHIPFQCNHKVRIFAIMFAHQRLVLCYIQRVWSPRAGSPRANDIPLERRTKTFKNINMGHVGRVTFKSGLRLLHSNQNQSYQNILKLTLCNFSVKREQKSVGCR